MLFVVSSLGTLCCLLQFNCLLVVVWSRDLYPAPPRCSGLQQQTRLATVSAHYLQATLSSWLVRVMIYGLFCLLLCDRGAYRRILLFLVGVLNTSDLDSYPEASVLSPPKYIKAKGSRNLIKQSSEEVKIVCRNILRRRKYRFKELIRIS